MPDLSHAAVQTWLDKNGSDATDAGDQTSLAPDDQPDVLPSVLRLGEALDQAREVSTDRTNALLAGRSGAGLLNGFLAEFGAGRRLRLLHWLGEPADAGSARVVHAVLGDEAHGSGAALRHWLLDLERRDLLKRLFQPERLRALLAACRASITQDQTP